MNPKEIIAAIIIAAASQLTNAAPVPSLFTYQGTLNVDGEPVQTDADFIIRLYNGATLEDSQSSLGVPVSNGQFQIELNYNPDLFDGTAYELEVLVRSPAGVGAYEALTPRQPLNTTPYAYHANTADSLLTPATIQDNLANHLLTLNQSNTLDDAAALRVTRGSAPAIAGTYINRAAEIETRDIPIGLLSFAYQFPVAGILDSNSTSTNSAAVLGQIAFDSPGGQTAIWGLNIPSNTQARLATDDHSADLIGDARIQGVITTDYAPGSFDLAAPIAYGFVFSSGATGYGTPNFSCTWNAANARYEIEIDNESYFFSDYVTTVTTNSRDLVASVSSSGGRLLVYLERTSDQAQVQGNFQFVTYKPSGAATIQGQRRAPLIPLATPYTDEELTQNPSPLQPRQPVIIEPTTKSPLTRD